jgi:hypothetical protein
LRQRLHKKPVEDASLAQPMHSMLMGSGFLGRVPEQFAGASPIRSRDVLENDVDVIGICTGVFNDAFGDVGGNSGFLCMFFTFEPAHTYDGHDGVLLGIDDRDRGARRAITICTVALLEPILLLSVLAINDLKL